MAGSYKRRSPTFSLVAATLLVWACAPLSAGSADSERGGSGSSITIKPDTIDAGQQFDIIGRGFPSRAEITFFQRTPSGDRGVFGAAKANRKGSFRDSADSRRSAEPGRYSVIACVQDRKPGCAKRAVDTIRIRRG